MSSEKLVPRFNGTMQMYDIEAVKKGIEESGLADNVKRVALRAINDSPHSSGKDFPTCDIVLVLSHEFNLRGSTVATVLDVIQNTKNATKEITIRK